MTAINFPFESELLRRARRIRQSAPTVTSFAGLGDMPTPLRGDGYAPYMHALAQASDDGTSGPVTVANGEPQRLLTDEYGRLWTRATTSGDITGAASRYTTGKAAEQQATIKADAGRVFQASMVLSGGGGDRVLMLFDKASAAVNGDAPIWRGVLPDPGAGNFGQVDVGFGEIDGLAFSLGLVVAASSTLDSLTLLNPAEAFFQVTYR